MKIVCRRYKGDFSYSDHYACEYDSKSIVMSKCNRQDYIELTNEYIDPIHHWIGMELWQWIVKAYEAGKNGEELEFIQNPVTEALNVDPYYKLDNLGNLLDENNNKIGKQEYRPTYWGEKLVHEEPVINGKLKSEIIEELWNNYLKENNITEEQLKTNKKVEVSNDELIEGVHYSKYRKDYDLIDIKWDNHKVV